MPNKRSKDSAQVLPPVEPDFKVVKMPLRSGLIWVLTGLSVLVAGVAEIIGKITIPLGVADLIILPMVWGLLISGIISSQKWKPLSLKIQGAATSLMAQTVLLLVTYLSFTMGPNIMVLFRAGPALLLQEVGHLFGTLIFALPLAVLLRMGPATIGTTFSIDREGYFAMVSEKYGSDSPQYRGVLCMYAFGTLFGAIIVGFIASVSASLHIFDPLALAMGSGVGSGSMMTAATGSVTAIYPEMEQELTAMAATSNLITVLLGVYVGMWVALPLADKLYTVLTRRHPQRDTSDSEAHPIQVPQVDIPTWQVLVTFSIAGVLVALSLSVRSH